MRIYSNTSADEVKSKMMNTFVQLSGIRDFSKIKVTLNLDDIVKKINNFRNI